MVRVTLVFGLASVLICGAADKPSRVVRTAQGPVRGYKDTAENFYAFYSIPYATAPTGPHKFKEPLPPSTWSEVFDATDQNIVCPQSKKFIETLGTNINYSITEDCLVINVFAPDTEEINLPVVVYVHGGGFQIGFGNMLKHTSLLKSGKLIVVNFNYRIGAHGFLCLGTENVPGNAGMKDMVAALRWVKRNIGNFGGDPDDVTIAGYSAGAAAVELLHLSASTQGLFNKVIPESGSSLGPWVVQNDPLDFAKSYARSLGFSNYDDVYALEKFYIEAPLDILQDQDQNRRDGLFGFAPCVERKENQDTFLTEAPIDILKKGNYEKMPFLAGFADMEGIFRLGMFENWKDHMEKNFSNFLPTDLHFKNNDERQNVAQRVKEFYFKKKPISSESALGYVDYFSDVMFVYPTYRSVALQVAAGSDAMYLYVYAFNQNRSSIPYPGVTGSSHCGQTMALFDASRMAVNEAEITDDYKDMKKLLADIWQNFIITGKTTPEGSLAIEVLGKWEPTSVVRPRHALFNSTSELRAALWPDRMALWDDIYSKHYNVPIPPPRPAKQLKSEL